MAADDLPMHGILLEYSSYSTKRDDKSRQWLGTLLGSEPLLKPTLTEVPPRGNNYWFKFNHDNSFLWVVKQVPLIIGLGSGKSGLNWWLRSAGLQYLDCWHTGVITVIIPPHNKVVGGVYWFHPSVRLSVRLASRVRSVAPPVLVGSISYLYILSSNFRRCVACKVSCKISKFEFFVSFLNL